MTLDRLIELCSPLHVANATPGSELTHFVMDSREAQTGSAFIAIRGTKVDGHMFIEDAIEQGASVIICEESYYTDNKNVAILEVENTTTLLGKLAQAFAGNPAEQLTIIGITGTNGKTTTATLVYQVLQACGKKASLLGTVNKRILDTVLDSRLTTSDPIELAQDMKKMVEAGSEFLVMEVSSHALHQHRVSGFDFKVAAFTNLSHDHLDYHHDMEEYFSAKKMLFDNLAEHSAAVANIDDPYGEMILKDCKATKWHLSFQNGSASITQNSSQGLGISIKGEKIQSALIGTFNAYNIGEAFLICYALGLDPHEISAALSKAPGAAGRMQPVLILAGEQLPKVLVDYAHTPNALQNVLSTLVEVKEPGQKLIVVFGAGGDRDTKKRPLMAQAAEQFADYIIVTSDNPRSENPDLIIADILDGFSNLEKVRSITNREEAIASAIQQATAHDIVLIAGKGHENYQEIMGKRYPFDDREVALAHLKQKTGAPG